MTAGDTIQSLLTLRKLTRAIADVVRPQLSEHLTTLTPLLRPKAVLGDFIQGGQREPNHKADKLFKELQALYDKIAPQKPFTLSRELAPPFNLANVGLEITPLDYPHAAQVGAENRKIMVRCPLTWVLTYAGFAPTRLPELLDTRSRSVEELQRFIVSQLVLHLAIASQPGVARILEALHLPVTTRKAPEFGELPLTLIGSSISTRRPADTVVIESAELTGMDAFEEVVNPQDIPRLTDPLRERLLEVARAQTPELV
jgi:hypothetical protein